MNYDDRESEKTGFTVDLSAEDWEPELAQKPSVLEELFGWLDVVAMAMITVVIVFTLVFRVATISGPSMQNTLFTQDKVIITNFAYTPKQGDIVVVSRNADNSVETQNTSDEPIIKRVIAVGGQTVDIDFIKGVVSVDGAVLDEPYTKTPTNLKYDLNFPITVPEGCVFVMGDNRNESLDSRASWIGENGMIDTRYILGHAVFRVYPFSGFGLLDQ